MTTLFKSKQKSVFLTPADDYPIHQVGLPIRHAGTSDRHFYDRYYFTGHGFGAEGGGAFLSCGFGQYPNLGVQDAFFCIVEGRKHRVIRASRHLDDRMDSRVGPLRVEVLEPLRRLRITIEDNGSGVSADLEYRASIPAYLEPRHFLRENGRVLIDTERYSQVGHWFGTIRVPGREITLSPDTWNAYRDHSWGVRPVGEPEPGGIRADDGHQSQLRLSGMWNYSTMQFDDFALLYMLHETNEGIRHMEEAVRIWKDPERDVEDLGVPVPTHEFVPGTRTVAGSVIDFPDAPGGGFSVKAIPLKRCFLSVGTGYGVEDEWRHGKYMGSDWCDFMERDLDDLDKWAHMLYVENLARFEIDDPRIGRQVGHGFHETGFIGPYEKLGFMTDKDVAK